MFVVAAMVVVIVRLATFLLMGLDFMLLVQHPAVESELKAVIGGDAASRLGLPVSDVDVLLLPGSVLAEVTASTNNADRVIQSLEAQDMAQVLKILESRVLQVSGLADLQVSEFSIVDASVQEAEATGSLQPSGSEDPATSENTTTMVPVVTRAPVTLPPQTAAEEEAIAAKTSEGNVGEMVVIGLASLFGLGLLTCVAGLAHHGCLKAAKQIRQAVRKEAWEEKDPDDDSNDVQGHCEHGFAVVVKPPKPPDFVNDMAPECVPGGGVGDLTSPDSSCDLPSAASVSNTRDLKEPPTLHFGKLHSPLPSVIGDLAPSPRLSPRGITSAGAGMASECSPMPLPLLVSPRATAASTAPSAAPSAVAVDLPILAEDQPSETSVVLRSPSTSLMDPPLPLDPVSLLASAPRDGELEAHVPDAGSPLPLVGAEVPANESLPVLPKDELSVTVEGLPLPSLPLAVLSPPLDSLPLLRAEADLPLDCQAQSSDVDSPLQLLSAELSSIGPVPLLPKVQGGSPHMREKDKEKEQEEPYMLWSCREHSGAASSEPEPAPEPPARLLAVTSDEEMFPVGEEVSGETQAQSLDDLSLPSTATLVGKRSRTANVKKRRKRSINRELFEEARTLAQDVQADQQALREKLEVLIEGVRAESLRQARVLEDLDLAIGNS